MKKIGCWLIGEAERFSFEERMFNFTLLLGIFATFYGAVSDYLVLSEGLLFFIFGALWLILYCLSRFKGPLKWMPVVAFGLLIFLFLPYAWFYSGGCYGVFPYYSIVFIGLMSIILNGRARLVLVVSMMAVIGLLIRADIRYNGVIIEYKNSGFSQVLFAHLTLALMIMVVLIIVYSNTYMNEKARGEKYARDIEENYRQQLYYMENLEQVIYRLKSERHDFNNHLGVVYGLLEGGEEGSALAYTRGLVTAAGAYQTIVNIPYSMIRAMLNYKLSSASEAGIALNLNIHVPEKLNLNEYDITVILGNLLDNAMEACAAISEGTGFITLNLRYKPNYLIIYVENPIKVGTLLPMSTTRTTKPDAANHGFGLKNIEYLVNRHHGFLKTESENDVFKVNIALLVAE